VSPEKAARKGIMIQPERIQVFQERPIRHGRYVLYWMQQSQRAEFNPALDVAIEHANALSKPVVAWCFGKHDRPWKERPVFGMVRYMNAEGLRRKFDMEAYIRRVDPPPS
jgi:deoxyribodipyrimidine photo-lyase